MPFLSPNQQRQSTEGNTFLILKCTVTYLRRECVTVIAAFPYPESFEERDKLHHEFGSVEE